MERFCKPSEIPSNRGVGWGGEERGIVGITLSLWRVCVKCKSARVFGHWWYFFEQTVSENKENNLRTLSWCNSKFSKERLKVLYSGHLNHESNGIENSNKQKFHWAEQWLCRCVINRGTFRSRPLRNNNVKWPISAYFGQRERRRLKFHSEHVFSWYAQVLRPGGVLNRSTHLRNSKVRVIVNSIGLCFFPVGY